MIAEVASQSHKLEVIGSNPIAAPKSFKEMGEKKIKKGMHVLAYSSLRSIVNAANDLGLQKEDIVSFLYVDGQYILVYYE